MSRGNQARKQIKTFRISLVLGLVLLLGWGLSNGATPVQAHAILVRSIPDFDVELAQPPPRIELWFSEPLELGVNRVRLITSAGEIIPLDEPTLDPDDPTHLTVSLETLPPEIYTVAWKNLSQADGHTWTGSFPFTILNPDGSRPAGLAASVAEEERDTFPSLGEALARWLALLGGALFFGAPLFQLFLVPDSGGGPDNRLKTQARALALRAVWVATLAVVLGAWLQILLQASRLGGLDRLPSLVLETRTNALVLTRQVMALSGLLLILNLSQPRPLHSQEKSFFIQLLAGGVGIILLLLLATAQIGVSGLLTIGALASFGLAGVTLFLPRDTVTFERRLWHTLLLMGGILLLTFSSGSHANAVQGNVWAVPVDYIHLLAAATWVGGLILLAILAWQLSRVESGRAQLMPLVKRFSYLAGFAVFILVATGLISSLVQLPGLAALVETPYGWVLLAKLCLIMLALLAAFLNNRLVHGQTPVLQDPVGQQRFNRQVALEAIFGLVVMISVAVLTQTATPRDLGLQAKRAQPLVPFNQVVKVDDLNVYLQIGPNQVGRNTFFVQLYNDDRSSIGQVQLVRLIFNYQDDQLGQSQIELEPISLNDFSAIGAYLNQSGKWHLSVYVRRRGMDDLLAQFNLEVPPSARTVSSSDALRNPVSSSFASLMIGGMLAVLGVLPFIRGRFWQRLRVLTFLNLN